MKNLKQILGLYIGQKAVSPEAPNINWVLYSLTNSDTVLFNNEDGASYKMPIDCIGKDMHLLLRKLSSMTEQEAREVCDCLELTFRDMAASEYCIEIRTRDGWFGIYEYGEIDMVDLYQGANTMLPALLCSMGFDCFGMVEKGYAK